MMNHNVRRFCRWFCAPDDIGLFPAFCFFVIGIILLCVMSVFYHGVILDNDVLKENPMYKMVLDMNSFVHDVELNVGGHQLLKDYVWLKNLKALINSNCSIMPKNLKKLRYTGFVFATYNTLLMHMLLSGTLPVSVIACTPIIASFIANYIDPAQIVLLGLFEFTQGVLLCVIMGTFFIIKDRRSVVFVSPDPNKYS